jgi:anti-sigma factor RsiW
MTIWVRHVSSQLAAHLDGTLPRRTEHQVDVHLQECARCRAERDEVRSGIEAMRHLSPVGAPDSVWTAIEAQLANVRPRRATTGSWQLAVFASVVLALVGATAWQLAQPSSVRWPVRRIAGTPAVSGRSLGSAGDIGAGEWVETDANSRATITIGKIGSVEVAPNTRVRIVATRADEHRLALPRGTIRATISAPPRLFFVDTPSGTAIDLGCEYELNTAEDGDGLLRVSKGWVSFQSNGLESLVPAGASCHTRAHASPGLPYFDDASLVMKGALATFDLGKGGGDAIGEILAESRGRDTLTLWHLMFRVGAGDRARVYDRIAALTPVPAGVSRDKALALDPATMTRWREELAWIW